MDPVGVIVSYSVLERPFIEALLREASFFASCIVVSYANKLFDGTPVDGADVDDLKQRYPWVRFVEYPVDLNMSPAAMKGVVNRPTAYHHNMSRWAAIRALNADVKWVYVLDADEIPDGRRVREWLRARLPKAVPSMCFKQSCYWYFKAPVFRAQLLEDSILLIHRSHLTEDNVFHDMERDGLISKSKARLERMVQGTDGLPMFHHYSWVRSRAGLARKLACWGHRDDIFKGVSVDDLMAKIYKDDEANDIVHGYQYDVVADQFGLGKALASRDAHTPKRSA